MCVECDGDVCGMYGEDVSVWRVMKGRTECDGCVWSVVGEM